ncbi:MAG: lipid-A-disaccharide synthase [Bacteroidales bacterium]|nr:lipid-A-disaccharide synthase [Bacteroidales bacterium]
MRYFIIAGEASGDLHGANLMRAIKKFDSKAEFRYLGGDQMASVADGLAMHYKDTAFMGLDVIWHLGKILKKIKFCKNEILSFQPDRVILIDFPGFNMRIAKYLYSKGIKVHYYIAPKAWAWKKKRVYELQKYVHRLYAIFPFEVEFFRQYNIPVYFFGNPLIDAINAFQKQKTDRTNFLKKHNLSDKPIISLVPGSRKKEIERLLPEMIKATEKLSDKYQLVVTGAPSIELDLYKQIIGERNIPVIFNATYQTISESVAAVVTSGTATLETALIGTPQVVVFKTGWLTFLIGRPIVRIRFFSLVNIIAGKEVVKELLQFNLPKKIEEELYKILNDADYAKQMHTEYCLIAHQLGMPGVAERIAHHIISGS